MYNLKFYIKIRQDPLVNVAVSQFNSGTLGNEPSKTKTNSIVPSKKILPFLRRASNQFRIPFPSGGRKLRAIPRPAVALRRNIFLRLD